jgi:hypothetical protein
MWIHIAYIAVIAFLLVALILVWRVQVSTGLKLLNINSLCAEMLLDEFRYSGIRLQFEALIYNERQPMMKEEADSGDFESSKKYWILTAFQVEKAAEHILLFEAGDQYETLAKVLHAKVTAERRKATSA